LGILLARWQRLQREKHGDKPQFAGSTWVALACAVATFIVVAHWYQVMPPGNLSDGLLVPIFAGVIWAFSRNESVLAKMLSVNWLVILGEASFGLYLIHIPVYQVYKHLNLEHIHALYPVYVATSIGLSVLSFYYFEAPARKWITRKFDTRPRETLEMASDAQ
jgi:peptidoglycan/LPS O-acetylase OafA/YrhL